MDTNLITHAVWPLTFLLVALFVLRKIRATIDPITQGLVAGLKTHSARHAMAWMMALMYASAASLQSLGEVATQLGWIYVAAFAKVIQPAVVSVIAFLNRPPDGLAAKSESTPSIKL